MLRLVGLLHRRSARIVLDWSRKAAKYLVLKARRMETAIAVGGWKTCGTMYPRSLALSLVDCHALPTGSSCRP